MFNDDKLKGTACMTREEVDAAFGVAAGTEFADLGNKTIREVTEFVCL